MVLAMVFTLSWTDTDWHGLARTHTD